MGSDQGLETRHERGEEVQQEQTVKEWGGDETEGRQERGGGVLEAIGETVAEIARSTKNLVIGEEEHDSRTIRPPRS